MTDRYGIAVAPGQHDQIIPGSGNGTRVIVMIQKHPSASGGQTGLPGYRFKVAIRDRSTVEHEHRLLEIT